MTALQASNALRVRPEMEPPLSDVFKSVMGPATASSTTPETGEKIYFGALSQGTKVTELVALYEAQGTGITWDIGFEPVDTDLDSGTVIAIDGKGNKITAANTSFFFSALSVAAAGRSVSASWPIRFMVPVNLVAVQTGTTTGTPMSELIVSGKYTGR